MLFSDVVSDFLQHIRHGLNLRLRHTRARWEGALLEQARGQRREWRW